MKKKNFLYDIRTAFAFMTVLPLRIGDDWEEGDTGRSALWYPLVGLVIGAVAALALKLSSGFFPPLLSAVVTVAIWVGASGALHLDGLADCCDGLFYPGTVEKRLTIMKDSHTGTFGTVGLLLDVVAKIACVSALVDLPGAGWALPFAAAGARWVLIPLAYFAKSARPDGMAAMLKVGLNKRTILLALVIPLVLAFFLLPESLLCLLMLCLWGGAVYEISLEQIHGISGDVLGFTIETSEILILLILVATKTAGAA